MAMSIEEKIVDIKRRIADMKMRIAAQEAHQNLLTEPVKTVNIQVNSEEKPRNNLDSIRDKLRAKT